MPKGYEVRLCLASQHFWPTPGGAQLRFLRYLPGLRERGVQSVVVTGTPKIRKLTASDRTQAWYEQPIGEVLPRETTENTPVHRIRLPERNSRRRSLIFYRGLYRLCRQGDSRPDVMQLLPALHPVSVPWLSRLRAVGIPLLAAYTIPLEVPAQPLKRAVRRVASWVLYRQLTCVVAGSAVMRDHARQHGVSAPIEVIPNGVDLRRFRPSVPDDEQKRIRDLLGLRNGDPMITAVGALTPRKGPDLLLEAWGRVARRLPDAHLTLIGPRADEDHPRWGEFERRLENLVRASGAGNRVHFTGFVSNVEEYLRVSDVFVFASSKEGQPNVVLEAMASGLPVVLTPFLGLSEDLGRPGHHYLLTERNSEALATAMVRLVESGDLRATIGRRARQWVEETMNVERSLDRYAALYHDLVRQARQGL
jgi:glycosyltransferase involved in cell wall biosynthesis